MRDSHQKHEQINNFDDLSVLRRNMEYFDSLVDFASINIQKDQNSETQKRQPFCGRLKYSKDNAKYNADDFDRQSQYFVTSWREDDGW